MTIQVRNNTFLQRAFTCFDVHCSIIRKGKNQRPFISTYVLTHVISVALSMNINKILKRTSKLTCVTTNIIRSCNPSLNEYNYNRQSNFDSYKIF